MARRASRVDANQTEIVAALRKIGATVTPTHMVADGFPDICVGYQGRNFMLEIKDGSKPPSAQKLTPAEERWHDKWRGNSAVVNSIEAAFAAVGVIALRGQINAGEGAL